MRCHYGVAIVNSAISRNLNTYSQPIFIHDFEFIRMETILALRMRTMEDTAYEVKRSFKRFIDCFNISSADCFVQTKIMSSRMNI
jgi:hypothetical protein